MKMSIFDKLFKKNENEWRYEKIKCCSCGYEWKCSFFYTKGADKKLQCPKCNAKNSMVIK